MGNIKQLQITKLKNKVMALPVLAAAAAGKRLSKKGRAKAKDKRAKRQDKRAERKMDRAKKLEEKGKGAKAAVLKAKANVKTKKAAASRERSAELKKKVSEGKTIKGRLKKAGKAVSDKVEKKGGVKGIVKDVASKTPTGRAVKAISDKVKAGKPKRDALKQERKASRKRKKAIRAGEGTTAAKSKKAAPVVAQAGAAEEMAQKTMKPVPAMYGGNKGDESAATKKVVKEVKADARKDYEGLGMYEGPGGQETPKLGRMSMGYGKGSKISYGHHSGMKMSNYAKAGLAGKGISMQTSAHTVLKHGATRKGKK